MKSNTRSNFKIFAGIGVAAAILFSFTALVQAQTHICTPAPVGLVSWWPGNGQAMDMRSQNHGAMIGGAYYGAGMTGDGFDFDGDGDYVQVAVPSGLPVGSSPRTMMAWIETPSSWGDTYQVIMQYGGNSTGSKFGLFIPAYYGRTASFWGEGNDYGGTTSLQISTWYHVAVTYDSTTVRIYVNGQLDSFQAKSLNTLNNAGGFTLGRTSPYDNIYSQWNGMVDEAAIYDRALSPGEIQAIYVAGAAGLCSPTAVLQPTGLVGWWSVDGNASDLSGNGNNGTLQNAPGYKVGKVGQGLELDGLDDYVAVANSPSLNPSLQVSVESWIYIPADTPASANGWGIVSKYQSLGGGYRGYELFLDANRKLVLRASEQGDTGMCTTVSASSLTVGQWNHVAGTVDTAACRVFINGSLEGSQPGLINIQANSEPVVIGTRESGVYGLFHFRGKIDETAIYNRALTPDEITSIVSAGIAGKLKTAVTNPPLRLAFRAKTIHRPLPAITQTVVGDATITFVNVNVAGVTQEIPLSLIGLPAYPPEYYSTGLIYDVSTSATYIGASVCFNLPALAPQFANLRIVHLENGQWINRTDLETSVNPNLCTIGLTSLSPFAIVSLVPTVASGTVGGRVMSSPGNGVPNARVSLTDQSGNSISVITSPFGYYRFEDISFGATYVFSVTSKRYIFDPQVLMLMEETMTVDFTANGFASQVSSRIREP